MWLLSVCPFLCKSVCSPLSLLFLYLTLCALWCPMFWLVFLAVCFWLCLISRLKNLIWAPGFVYMFKDWYLIFIAFLPSKPCFHCITVFIYTPKVITLSLVLPLVAWFLKFQKNKRGHNKGLLNSGLIWNKYRNKKLDSQCYRLFMMCMICNRDSITERLLINLYLQWKL